MGRCLSLRAASLTSLQVAQPDSCAAELEGMVRRCRSIFACGTRPCQDIVFEPPGASSTTCVVELRVSRGTIGRRRSVPIGPSNSSAEARTDGSYLCKCWQVFCSSETPRASGLRMAPTTVNPDSGLLGTAQTSAIGFWQMYAACLRLQLRHNTKHAAFDPSSRSPILWLFIFSCHASC